MKHLRERPLVSAALAQIIAAVVALAVVRFGHGILSPGWLLPLALGVQIWVAFGLTLSLRLPVWWRWIAMVFPVALFLALLMPGLPAWPFAVAFVVLYLFFSNTAKERVPLYLTNKQTASALLSLMQDKGAQRFLDIGSGFGGVVRSLAGEGRNARGVETAPMAWLVSAGLSALTGKGKILRQDLWKTDLSQEDIVYAFLSPEPMAALWDKAKREMKPGSYLVSNSFAVPQVDPDEVWELTDRRRTQLFIYAIRSAESHGGNGSG